MSHHRFPVCPISGKVRYGERKDIKLAMREAEWDRSRARVNEVTCSRREIRSYQCEDCHGWHLTSQQARPARPVRLVPSRYVTHTPGPAAQAIRRMFTANRPTAGSAA